MTSIYAAIRFNELANKMQFFLVNGILYGAWGSWFAIADFIRNDLYPKPECRAAAAAAAAANATLRALSSQVCDAGAYTAGAWVLLVYAVICMAVLLPVWWYFISKRFRREAELAAAESGALDDDEAHFKVKLQGKSIDLFLGTTMALPAQARGGRCRGTHLPFPPPCCRRAAPAGWLAAYRAEIRAL